MAKEQVLKVTYNPPFELEVLILGPTGDVVVPWRVPPCWAELLFELLRNDPRWTVYRASPTEEWRALAIEQPE